jgi:plasmid replication initiation protein
MALVKDDTREHKLILRALAHTTQIEKKICMGIGNKLNKLSLKEAEKFREEKKMYFLEIPIEKLSDQINTSYRAIKNACFKLTSRKIPMCIEYNLKNGQTELFDTIQNIFVGAGISNNHFQISINPEVLPLFSRALDIYRHYNIIEAKFLTHKHSIELYKFIKDKVNQNKLEFIISVKNLKLELGLESKYKLYADFKKRVIDEVKKDLKKNSSVYFEYKEIKPSRSVTDLIFFIHKNEEMEHEIYFKERLKTYTKQTPDYNFVQDFTEFLKKEFCLSPVSKTLNNIEYQKQIKLLASFQKLSKYPKEIQERFIKFIDHPEML